MKLIKSFLHITLSVATALLIIQSLLALLIVFLPMTDLSSFNTLGITMSGHISLGNLAVLLMHNGLWIVGLHMLKRQIKHFQLSDLMTEDFSKTIKRLGGLIFLAELFSSYLTTIQAPVGTYIIDIKYSVYLIIAGFACDYARRYMTKENLTI
ncbi:hypothetical protein [Streptococcus moroccensis]|uniref:DUF2975 domain-containing protein n=1 Tax=Streptococcus moroccensis TaxID=1451356 RepID=A0ABT9YT22_9STRE|nr:hypothetical protein [Streptococcus moroccensis]MDQ0223139.1 hypothetical protein [Streptococcus moroccensis]